MTGPAGIRAERRHAAGRLAWAAAVWVLLVAGCTREWTSVPCFELGGRRYAKPFYTPEHYRTNSDRLEAQAYFLYGAGDYQEALECLMQMRDQLDAKRAATMIGIIHTRLEAYDEAEKWLRTGIEEGEDPDWAWAALIWHYCEVGRLAKAEEAAKTLTGLTASPESWHALKTVRRLRREAEVRARWLRALPWLGAAAAVLAVVVAFRIPVWRRRRREKAREAHVKAMEQELHLLHVRTSLSIDQVKAKLLEERAKSTAAAFLHQLVVQGHLDANESSLKGIQGLIAIYRHSLKELDKLVLEEKERDRRREELEKALKAMVRGLSGGAGP
ncbi:MAG: tetratricopeptide repeat protein [Candidatus Hydrogenedentes bacterium]|nr:tetratricopeptide repeat protein [Candidatus Hydrogenedentota bacterium]